MAYFGGGGVKGNLHPSLKTYIDCFLSPPLPKRFPRAGGVWDQDPILMRDFRLILNFEREWKDAQEQISSMQQKGSGGGLGLEDALKEHLENLGESGMF